MSGTDPDVALRPQAAAVAAFETHAARFKLYR
jgi:hypothetical protein